jgi:hypothetical protein
MRKINKISAGNTYLTSRPEYLRNPLNIETLGYPNGFPGVFVVYAHHVRITAV